MPEIAIISEGVNYTLLSTDHPNEWYLTDSTGSRVLGRITHELPLGWSGQTLYDIREATKDSRWIRISRLDAIQDLIEIDRNQWLAKFTRQH